MALSNMQVFNDYIMPATIETLAQMIDKFNAASAGTIVLTTAGFTGDFLQESFFAGIHAAQRRVDRYASNSAVTPTNLSQLRNDAVKVAGGFGPILYEPSQMTWLQQPTARGVEVASRNFAEALLADQLNTSIAALCAAIGNQAAATNNISAGTAPAGALTYNAINNSHALFGDSSSLLLADVMNGRAYHKLIGANLTNPAQLFQAGNVRVVDILGKAVVVTDAPALFVDTTVDELKVLSLAANAAIVTDAGDIITNVQTTNGKERIETTMQVDYSFALRLKGYTWDIANGGKTPTNAELATGSNWDLTATSIKQTAGVITIAAAAQ